MTVITQPRTQTLTTGRQMDRLVAEDQKDHRSKISGPLYRPIDGSCVSLAISPEGTKQTSSLSRSETNTAVDPFPGHTFASPSPGSK